MTLFLAYFAHSELVHVLSGQSAGRRAAAIPLAVRRLKMIGQSQLMSEAGSPPETDYFSEKCCIKKTYFETPFFKQRVVSLGLK